MGNGLRKAICDERWTVVRDMLEDYSVKSRVRTKHYKAFRTTARRRWKIWDEYDWIEERVTVLHLVLQRRPPLDVVKTLIDICPQAVHEPSIPSQELPLHYALRCSYPSTIQRREVIELLLKVHPESIAAVTANGQTPLHVACQSTCSAPIVELLVSRYPLATSLIDNHERKPWDWVKANTRFWNMCYRNRIRQIMELEGRSNDQMVPLTRQDMQLAVIT